MARGLALLAVPVLALALVACADEDLRDQVALAPLRSLAAGDAAPDFELVPATTEAGALLVASPSAADPARLTALVGSAARNIDVGNWDVSGASISPDDRYAAFVASGSGSQVPNELGLVEVASGRPVGSWETTAPYAAVWGPSSDRLLAFTDQCEAMADDGTCPAGWQHELTSWDVEARAPSAVGAYDFWLSDPVVSPDGSTFYGIGWRSKQGNGIDVEGAPFLAAIDLATGHVRAEVPLDSVRLGQRIEQRPDGEFGVSRWPALALAPDGSRAYVAHADDEGITVVDLARMVATQTATPRFASSPLARVGASLASRLASHAEAKGGLYFAPQIVVSPDGSRLYLSGVGSETCPGQDYLACVEGAPLGLRVVDADSLQLLRQIDGVGHIAVSPDGSMLAGTAVVTDGRGIGDGDPYRQLAAGLVLLRLNDLARAPEALRAGVAYDQIGFDPAGRLYARATLPPSEANRCLDGCSLLTVLDAGGHVLADRQITGASTLVTR